LKKYFQGNSTKCNTGIKQAEIGSLPKSKRYLTSVPHKFSSAMSSWLTPERGWPCECHSTVICRGSCSYIPASIQHQAKV